MYVPLDAFLLRAPLLPEATLGNARALSQHPLGAMAIELASASLARGKEKERALGRYARRAGFRATPQGLLAGVCVGELGDRIAVTTGRAAAVLAPSWARMAALGRGLLDDPAVRARARLRVAPSLVHAAGGGVRWIGPGDPFGETREAEVDARVARVLAATTRWAAWEEARRALDDGEEDEDEDGDGDELLLLLVDEGLLIPDLVPPLVGRAAGVWMKARLEALGCVVEGAALDVALRALAAEDLAAARRALGALPGAESGAADVYAVLAFRPRRPPCLPRAAVERAAALAPLLFALQEALAPPAAERLAQPALADALDATTEIFGAGALDLDALAGGVYGVDPAGDEDEPPPAPAPPARIVAALAGAIVEAAAHGRDEAALDSATLAAALDGAGRGAAPPSAELFLTPGRSPRGARPGTGWLLGAHAPAGASWGRFAGALGAPLARALAALDAAERAARPFEERLDVAFAPSPALADLCAHPSVRPRALALSSWSEGNDVAPRDLELCADPAAEPPLCLRLRRGAKDQHELAPSPLWRVRSATAPPGVARLLVGWSLWRQHAPWALALGPLGGLARIPRLSLDGFVVSPASWAIPGPIRGATATRAAVRRWRRDAGLPRWVQVGQEDRLLPVDLDAAGAAADLRGADRAWEIWPPLGSTVDRGGRRVEAVVALIDRPDPDESARLARAAGAAAAMGRVPPPRAQPALPGWLTFKLFGPADLQDALLVVAVAPAIRAARRAREIRGWFFIRYVDGPGRRPHLRVRAQAAGKRGLAAFESRLRAALAPARAAGAVATVESGEYHPERARFGSSTATLAAVHAVFESDSELACALIVAQGDADADLVEGTERTALLVRALDALARGLGLDRAERHALARARRRAEERTGDPDPEAHAARDRAFRAGGRALRAMLGGRGAGSDAAARALDAHAERTGRATRRLPREQRAALAPALLHLACVRLAGPDRDAELDAYTFWERTLEGLLRSDDIR